MWTLLTKLRCCGDNLVLSGDSPAPHPHGSPSPIAVSSMMEQRPVLGFEIPKLDFTIPCDNDLMPKLELVAPNSKDMSEDPASASTTCSPPSLSLPLDRCRTTTSRCAQGDTQSSSVRQFSSRHCPGSGSKATQQAREINHVTPRQSPRLHLDIPSPDSDISAIDISNGDIEAQSPSSIASEIPGELNVLNATSKGYDLPGPGACLEDIDEVPVLLPQGGTRHHFTKIREPLNKQREIGFGHEFVNANEAALGLKGMTVLRDV